MSPSPERERRAPIRHAPAIAFVTIASLAFSTSGPIARWGRPTPPMALACGRMLVAGVILALIDRAGLVTTLRTLAPRTRSIVLLAGAILAAHFALFLVGLNRTSLPAGIALVSIEPVSVVLAAWAIHGLRPRRRETLGVAFACLGGIAIASGAGEGEHRLAGDLMVLGACALYGVYVAIARTVKDELSPQHYAATVYLSGAVALAPFALFATVTDSVGAFDAHSWMAIALLALIPTIVGHTMVQTASRTMSPAIVSLVSPLETLGGILIGMLYFKAIPTTVEALGAAAIVAGAIVTL